MSVATKVKRYKKPYPSFPLTVHPHGWCKKINGKVKVICGHLPPQEALQVYLQKMPMLHAAKAQVLPVVEVCTVTQVPTPVVPVSPSVTVVSVKDGYLAAKERELRAGLLKSRSYMSLMEILPPFVATMPESVTELSPQHFADYRFKLASKYSAYALDRHVTNIRAMFNWAVRNGVLNSLPKWGDSFDKPSQTQKRRHRHAIAAKNGKRMFTRSEVRQLLEMATPVMKAMVYLGINCGMGNTDIAELPRSAVDLSSGTLDYPRPKTSQERRAILWPETVEAVRQALHVRPEPVDPKDQHLVFLTPEGRPWVHNELKEKDGKVVGISKTDMITWAFKRLMRRSGIASDESGRQGLSFYALRHTYRTIADECMDQHAVHLTMGHAIPGMAGVYVQQIKDERLRKVAEHVRSQVLESQLDHTINEVAVSAL